MAYSATWLPKVLRLAGLKVVEYPGWETRGVGEIYPKFVICHHTAGPAGRTAQFEIDLIAQGRPDLSGPLSQMFLARDGTYYVIAAGAGHHAGKGKWKGIANGNTYAIGIEAENDGKGEVWPQVQMDAYAKGVAWILEHLGRDEQYVCGHKEYALPKGRKPDPNFDMDVFRNRVAEFMI